MYWGALELALVISLLRGHALEACSLRFCVGVYAAFLTLGAVYTGLMYEPAFLAQAVWVVGWTVWAYALFFGLDSCEQLTLPWFVVIAVGLGVRFVLPALWPEVLGAGGVAGRYG